MSAPMEELKSTLSALPVAERAEIAHYLLHTLEPAQADSADEWMMLAEQRTAEARRGDVVGIPAEQVLESLRRPRP